MSGRTGDSARANGHYDRVMTDAKRASCATCYGTGEIVTEQGSLVCPDCLGRGLPPARGGAMEWRLRELERAHQGAAHGCEADVRWLIVELRRSREALVQILTRCQDATEPLARELEFVANEVLGLYEKV
jgi:hypothetical protein